MNEFLMTLFFFIFSNSSLCLQFGSTGIIRTCGCLITRPCNGIPPLLIVLLSGDRHHSLMCLM